MTTPSRMHACLRRLDGPPGVAVWVVALDDRDVRPAAHALLDARERATAARIRHPDAAARYVVAHGALRWLLGRAIGAPAAEIRFERLSHGKPVLADEPERCRFNLSHSEDVALIALSARLEVGIDVERIRPPGPLREIARLACCAREQERLRALPDAASAHGFLRLWTAKEAYVKASGEGLSYGLARLDFAELLERSELDAGRYRVEVGRPLAGYVSGLAHGGVAELGATS